MVERIDGMMMMIVLILDYNYIELDKGCNIHVQLMVRDVSILVYCGSILGCKFRVMSGK